MWKIYATVIAAIMAAATAGCGKSAATNQTATSTGSETATVAADAAQSGQKLDAPAAATRDFLEALRTGNDEKATAMISTVAREKAASLNRNVTPPASDTARFTIGKVEYVGEDGAQVACTWTDLDENGQPRTDTAVWVLRRESEGWRIVGVAAKIFPDRDPVVLNFEDPEDMLRQQQWVREEMRAADGTGPDAGPTGWKIRKNRFSADEIK